MSYFNFNFLMTRTTSRALVVASINTKTNTRVHFLLFFLPRLAAFKWPLDFDKIPRYGQGEGLQVADTLGQRFAGYQMKWNRTRISVYWPCAFLHFPLASFDVADS